MCAVHTLLTVGAQGRGFNDLQALGDKKEILGPKQVEGQVRDHV